MANFGIGLGAFADGFARGYGIRRQMNADKRAEEQQKRDDELRKGFADARKDYDAQVADNVLTQAGQSDPNKPFDVDQANSQAKQKVGSFSDYMYSTALPKIIDTAIANGDIKQAEMLRKWGDDAGERKRTNLFGSALNDFYAGQATGDYKPFADKAMKLMNDGGYGVKANGYDFVKDNDGNTTGITFNLQDGDRKYSHTFNSMQDMGQFLAGQADPRSRVKLFMSQAGAADKFKQKMAEEQGKAQIGLSRDMAMEDHRQENRLQLAEAKSKETGSKVQKDFEFMQGLLKQNGFSDDEIRAYIPAMLKIGEYRKGRSPEEYAQQIVLEMQKDPLMRSKPIEELKARATQIVQLAQGVAQAAQRPAAQPGIAGSVVPNSR